MPYDAFGNKIDEDPLAGLGSHPAGVPGGRPPRRGRLTAAVATAVVIAGVAVGLVALTAGSDPVTSSSSSTTSSTSASTVAFEAEEDPAPETPSEPAKPAEPAKPPTGLQKGSLLRPANLEVALRRLKATAKGRPRTVRVEAERVDIQVILLDGRMRNAQATWDGEVRNISTTPTPIGGLKGFAWGKIDPAAPRRLVRSATGRERKPASAFNYAVLLDISGLRWSAFLKNGAAFSASSSGRIERQISG